MSTHRSRRINRHTAEHLLRGQPVEDQPGLDPLAGLLAAAAVPSRDGEPCGEQAAVSAFRTAHLGPVARPRRPSVLSSLLSPLLTAKIAAAALTVAAVGGVAVAATSGVLPAVHGGNAPAGVHTSSQSPSTPAPPGPPATVEDAGEGARNAGAGNGQHAAAPSPSLLGLCHAYLAGAGSTPGKALDSPAFAALTTAAGGAGNVRGYCDSVLAAHAGAAGNNSAAGNDGAAGNNSGATPDSAATHAEQGVDPTRPAHPAVPAPASGEATGHAPTSPAPGPAPQPPAAPQAAAHAPSAPPGR